MARELLESARPVFAAAMTAADSDDELVWELGWNAINTPAGLQTGFWVYIHIPAHHVLGAYLQRVFMAPIGVDDETLTKLCRDQVLELKSERRRLLAQQSNGQPPAQPGQLFIPPPGR